jgi:hypothetical protein
MTISVVLEEFQQLFLMKNLRKPTLEVNFFKLRKLDTANLQQNHNEEIFESFVLRLITKQLYSYYHYFFFKHSILGFDQSYKTRKNH